MLKNYLAVLAASLLLVFAADAITVAAAQGENADVSGAYVPSAYKTVPQGGELHYVIDFSKAGSERSDVVVTANLIHAETGLTAVRKQETIAVLTVFRIERAIKLPESMPTGGYTLEVVTEHNGEVYRNYDTFEIAPGPLKPIPEQGDRGDYSIAIIAVMITGIAVMLVFLQAEHRHSRRLRKQMQN